MKKILSINLKKEYIKKETPSYILVVLFFETFLKKTKLQNLQFCLSN